MKDSGQHSVPSAWKNACAIFEAMERKKSMDDAKAEGAALETVKDVLLRPVSEPVLQELPTKLKVRP